MRLVVARCSVVYTGRLGARLPEARRLIMLKDDGSIAIHADAKAYKPLNWMSPPCSIIETDGALVATNPAGERLDRDGSLAPIRAMLVATRVKPQARVFAESRGVVWREIDLESLRADAPPDLRLF